MSYRQPAARATSMSTVIVRRLFFNIVNLLGSESPHKLAGLVVIVELVRGFDDQEKLISRCESKPGHVEYRMIRRWQLVQEQHSKHGNERGKKDRQLKHRRNKGRQTEVGPSAHDYR